MFSFFKRRKLDDVVPMLDVQTKPEQPEEKEPVKPVRTEFKNGCFAIRNEEGQTLYSKNGEILVKDTCKTFIFADAVDGEFVSVRRDTTSFWTYEYHYVIYNADGLRVYTDGAFIKNEKEIGPNLIMFENNFCDDTELSIYSKVLKRFVSPEDGMRIFWFDGVIGIFNEDKELTAVKAVRDWDENIGYGTLMESKRYRTTYIIDLDGNIIEENKEEIKEEKNGQERFHNQN